MEGQVAVLISCLQGWGLEQPLMSAVCENELFGYAPDLPTIGFWQSGGWRGGGVMGYIFCSISPKIGEGNGNPLQYSCLENPRDGGARWATISGVAQSWT